MSQLHRRLAIEPNDTLPSYAWPGGYPIYYVDHDNSVMCPDCAIKSDTDDELPNYRPCDYGINYEDGSLFCDQCNKRIESAYAEGN